MNESVEQQQTFQSALHPWHTSNGADMRENGDWLVPHSFGDPQREYAAVRVDGAGLIDLSHRGRIEVSGTESTQFLNGLITNDMKTLAVGQWMPAMFPTVQGRLIGSVRVIRREDVAGEKGASPMYVLDTEHATHRAVLQTIERFTLAGDFRVRDITQTTAMISLQGAKATEILQRVVSDLDLAANSSQTVKWQSGQVLAVRATHTNEEGFDLIVASELAVQFWEALIAAGAQPTGMAAFETLRIEAGIPRFGLDMDDTTVVSETNLDEAISFTKGCYLGQEIVVRIKHRGHVAKKIAGIVFPETANVEPGLPVWADEKEIGRLSSVTFSPKLGRTIALATLKYQYLAAGTEVKVKTGEEMIAGEVVELPFIESGK